MAEVTLNVSPEDIRNALTKSILEGAIGKEIEAALKRIAGSETWHIREAIEKAVDNEVRLIISEYVREKLTGPLKEMVEKKILDETLEKIVDFSVSKIIRGY